jgi:hypothetical protein
MGLQGLGHFDKYHYGHLNVSPTGSLKSLNYFRKAIIFLLPFKSRLHQTSDVRLMEGYNYFLLNSIVIRFLSWDFLTLKT